MLARSDSSADVRRWFPSLLGVALLASLLAPSPALAQPNTIPSLTTPTSPRQPNPMPSPEDMARALQARPLPTPDRLATQPKREVPRIGPAPTPPSTPGTLDIAAMARQGAALSAEAATRNNSIPLRIFVTLDMPHASLQRLVDQAHRAGATLVLRGLKAQSMRQTASAVAALLETRSVSWVIDPDAFTRYRVSVAPTFVLSLIDDKAIGTPASQPGTDKPLCVGGDGGVGLDLGVGSGGCSVPLADDAFLSVSGDVSLDYALDAMVRRNPQAAPRARALLQRLRKP